MINGSTIYRTDGLIQKVIGPIFIQKTRISIIIKLTTTNMIGDPRMNNFISNTLQLKDENIFIDFESKDSSKQIEFRGVQSLFYYGKLDTNPQYCPACGCIKEGNNIVKNGAKESRITLTKISGVPAYLMLKKTALLLQRM